MADQAMIERFRAARRDPALAVLEGFHALKHALRFGAALLDVAVREGTSLGELASALAPDVPDRLATPPRTLPAKTDRKSVV